jgi:hypothetical protein
MTDEEFRRFLRNGPVFSEEEIASIEEGSGEFRRRGPRIPRKTLAGESGDS